MFPEHLLKDQHIVITGAQGLLGRSIANYCQRAGANVLGLDINGEGEHAFKLESLDVTSMDEVQKKLDKWEKEGVVLDGWVNAAYPRTEDWGVPLEDITDESWDRNISLQLGSVSSICRRVGVMMSERGHGSVVNLGSIYGELAPQFDLYEGLSLTTPAAYAAIKGGLINFTRYLAAYFGPRGVRFNCVSPGGILNGHSDVFSERYSKKTMLERMGRPEEVAAATAFLLSDQASYITGHNLLVDGGWSAR